MIFQKVDFKIVVESDTVRAAATATPPKLECALLTLNDLLILRAGSIAERETSETLAIAEDYSTEAIRAEVAVGGETDTRIDISRDRNSRTQRKQPFFVLSSTSFSSYSRYIIESSLISSFYLSKSVECIFVQ